MLLLIDHIDVRRPNADPLDATTAHWTPYPQLIAVRTLHNRQVLHAREIGDFKSLNPMMNSVHLLVVVLGKSKALCQIRTVMMKLSK